MTKMTVKEFVIDMIFMLTVIAFAMMILCSMCIVLVDEQVDLRCDVALILTLIVAGMIDWAATIGNKAYNLFKEDGE